MRRVETAERQFGVHLRLIHEADTLEDRVVVDADDGFHRCVPGQLHTQLVGMCYPSILARILRRGGGASAT